MARPRDLAAAAQSPAPSEPAEPAAAAAPAEPAAPVASVAETATDVSAALAEALAGGTSPGGTTSVPLSTGERDSLRLAVQACWVVDVGSQAANVTVTLAFDMEPNGRVVAASLRMIGASEGPGAAVDAAFRAARAAVLRCDVQNGGYDLPADKYDQWKQIEMTFNPAQMRLR